VTGLLLLCLFGFGGLAWWRLLQGKERARHVATLACRQHGLNLMDDTVMLDGIKLLDDEEIRGYGLRYRFDFVHEGILRQGGSVMIRPGARATVIITTTSGQLIEEF